jgi:cell division septation protein DedD
VSDSNRFPARPSGRRSSRLFNGVVTGLILLVLGAAPAVSRPLQLEEAWQLERSGDAAAAARLYIAWAREHAGKPSSLAGYAGFLRTERGLDALIDACRDVADSLPRLPGAWPLLAETAQLFELAGLDEEAAAIALSAWSRGGPAMLLRRAMRLTLAMGDLDAYDASAARTVSVPGLDPLAATRDLLAGRLEEARQGAARIIAAVDTPEAKLMAAWNLFAAARAGGAAPDIAQAGARIADLFPGSPESAIAAAEVSGKRLRIVEAPSPSLFVSAGPATAKAPAPEAPPVPPAAKTFSVQAGSFQVRENADELVKDLARAGFTPQVREASVQGRTLYRVLAAAGLDRDSAAALLERLRAAGYSGITVAE